MDAISTRRKIIFTALMLLVMLAGIEGGSFLFLKVYTAVRFGSADPAVTGYDKIKDREYAEEYRKYDSDYRVRHQYAHYFTYTMGPYTSETLNIWPNGYRKNKKDDQVLPHIIDKPRLSVWIAGSSAVFGILTRDEETVAAQLENFLKLTFPNHSVEVRNLGVIGHTSIQDYLKVFYLSLLAPPRRLLSF